MVQRHEFDAYASALLEVDRFRDYGPNGLQVEGRPEIVRIVSGVTASRAFIQAAIAAGADALVVHHGLFWRGQDGRVVGWMKQRLELLLAAQINLFAYHLPLDAHASLGNNAQLGSKLGLTGDARFGEQQLGWLGAVDPVALGSLGRRVQDVVRREIVIVEGDGRAIRRVAWCTGGAQGYFEAAIAAGADVYITGEISEPQAHYARETGVAFIACGHHASERFGAPALGAHLAERFGLEHRFIDIENPA